MRKLYNSFFISILFLASFVLSAVEYERPICVVIPTYNNEQWCELCLYSVFVQQYSNYRVHIIFDACTDATVEKSVQYINNSGHADKVTCTVNTERHGALCNLYDAIHQADDDEIIITLDGDDWLAHDQVFAYINRCYADENIWLTYGQFVEYPSNRIGFSEGFPRQVIEQNGYRKHGLPVSHLRTFYAWLFKKIKKEDLLYNGEFFPMTWDKAMMTPMIEMSGGRFAAINDVLYVYNFANPISDMRVNGELQANLAQYIRAMIPYEPVKDIRVHEKAVLSKK